MTTIRRALIETDSFPFEFISQIAERESWRKEIHRPIYHIHKWWAKRLGSVFRAILLGGVLDSEADLHSAFYASHDLRGTIVLDPFMGSGTTIGEAHKLGLTALGRDINPVAVASARVAFGPMDEQAIEAAYARLDTAVGRRLRALYDTREADGSGSEVLYYFWVMRVACPQCAGQVDLFPSFVFASNAYPKRKPEVQVVCPSCGDVFEGRYGREREACPTCQTAFDPRNGHARGQTATCPHCEHQFAILKAVTTERRPEFRQYAKLVLRRDGTKAYHRTTADDEVAYGRATVLLSEEVGAGRIHLPDLALVGGYNTSQAMRYGFTTWQSFFNDRQLLALGWLRAAILDLDDEVREVFLTLFSGLLEFNNLFASYKGEGTGAVRHMFSHHILKPERTPIEANVWGTPKSSGSFSGLYRGRLRRALAYRAAPTEVNGTRDRGVVASPPFAGQVQDWPVTLDATNRAIYLSCGDSASLGLPERSIDLVVTDPPFFDNVHYSELADFFFAWQQIGSNGISVTTRSAAEVQDVAADDFSAKLRNVFAECRRVLKDDGLLVFTYHHSREEGWHAVANALLGSGFVAVASHPVKAEMSVAMPVAAAKDPISFDIVLVCRKAPISVGRDGRAAITTARAQIERLRSAGFTLTKADCRTVEFGQLLTTVATPNDVLRLADHPERLLAAAERAADEQVA